MISNLFNGADVKKYAKHLLYPNSQTTKSNELKHRKFAQSHIFTTNKHKDSINSYTQRTLFTKDPIANERNKQSQSLLNSLSPRLDKKSKRISKTSGPQTPTKTQENAFITFKVSYKSHFHIVNLNRGENGLNLASKLKSDLRLDMSKEQLELFALHLTREVNKIIESLPSTESKLSGANRNVNGFVIDINTLLLKRQKMKIAINYDLMSFTYYITNTPEEVDGVIEDIIQHINNDKYDRETLKRDLRISVIESIHKAL